MWFMQHSASLLALVHKIKRRKSDFMVYCVTEHPLDSKKGSTMRTLPDVDHYVESGFMVILHLIRLYLISNNYQFIRDKFVN